MFFDYAAAQCKAMDDLQEALKALTGQEYDLFQEWVF
jgi:hypothetical protein